MHVTTKRPQKPQGMKNFLTKLISTALAFVSLTAAAVTRYVDLNSPSPTPPYTSWPTAATNIQDAIEAAVDGDLVLVTNGIYQTGGGVVLGGQSNRVAVTKPITLQSVNGPQHTVIEGIPRTLMGATRMRCVYVTNNATMIGFTLTNGSAASGGGVWCAAFSAVISNCVVGKNSASQYGGGVFGGTVIDSELIQNSASSGGGGTCSNTVINSRIIQNASLKGGGAYRATVERSLILTNSSIGGQGGSSGEGGGAYLGTLVNCVVAGNSSDVAGGASLAALTQCSVVGNSGGNGAGVFGCTLTNSIVYYNNGVGQIKVNHIGSTFNSCCTTNPNPPFGLGNITAPPLFVDLTSTDLRLQSNSPCINSGNNGQVSAGNDLDGNPRIAGGAVDMGAYEFQSPSSVLSYTWAQKNGLPTDGSADFTDIDSDGMNNYGEWRSDTIPTNTLSVLRMVNATNSPSGAKVTWQSVSTRSYWLERATNLGAASPFQTIATNVAGVAGTKTFTDTSATNAVQFFYRVGVH